jgi:hypothetical protein
LVAIKKRLASDHNNGVQNFCSDIQPPLLT